MSTQLANPSEPSAGTPGIGRRLYLGWLELAAHFGEIQTQLIVSFVYVFVLGPMSIVASLARRDFLAKRGFAGTQSVWNTADSVSRPDVARAKRLF